MKMEETSTVFSYFFGREKHMKCISKDSWYITKTRLFDFWFRALYDLKWSNKGGSEIQVYKNRKQVSLSASLSTTRSRPSLLDDIYRRNKCIFTANIYKLHFNHQSHYQYKKYEFTERTCLLLPID